MTRFVFLTDTHLGADPMGYQQQSGHPERLADLLCLLERWIARAGGVDFVLHGGDIVDACRRDLIDRAASRWVLAQPTYLCLGNHDLTSHEAVSLWLQRAPGFFAGCSPHFEVVRADCVLHVVPSHWDELDYHWEQVQRPWFSDDQIARIDETVERYPHRPHVLCTHSPVFGIPTEQTGFSEPYHDPGLAFRETVLALVARHPQVRCVLAGHNHINSAVRYRDLVVISAPAFTEVPFEFKLIQIDVGQLSVRTHSLFSETDFGATYDFDRGFVQGRACDRHVTLDLN